MNLSLNLYWGILSRYLLPRRFAVIGLGLTLLISIVLQLISPQLLRQFIDLLSQGSFPTSLWNITYIFIGITIGNQFLEI